MVRKLLVHARMQQSPRCPSRRRARGIGISTAFFRPDFKGDRARSRTCVRAWTTVKVDEWHSSSHCADVSRKDSTSLSSDCATGRTSFRRAIEIESERGSLDRKKNDPLTLRAVARGHENRASIDLSFLLSSGGEKRPIRSSNSRGFSVIVSESSTNN